MEEEIKKRGRGRPRKGEVVPKKDNRGGARAGAGRKSAGDKARTKHFSFGVSEQAVRQSNALRELTKQDDKSFVDMLEEWIAEQAEKYGVE